MLTATRPTRNSSHLAELKMQLFDNCILFTIVATETNPSHSESTFYKCFTVAGRQIYAIHTCMHTNTQQSFPQVFFFQQRCSYIHEHVMLACDDVCLIKLPQYHCLPFVSTFICKNVYQKIIINVKSGFCTELQMSSSS